MDLLLMRHVGRRGRAQVHDFEACLGRMGKLLVGGGEAGHRAGGRKISELLDLVHDACRQFRV